MLILVYSRFVCVVEICSVSVLGFSSSVDVINT